MKKFKYLFRRQQIPANKAKFLLHTIVLAENNKQRGGSTEKHTTHNHPHRHAPVAPTHSRNPAQAPESVFSWIKAFESGGTLTPCLNSKFRKKIPVPRLWFAPIFDSGGSAKILLETPAELSVQNSSRGFCQWCWLFLPRAYYIFCKHCKDTGFFITLLPLWKCWGESCYLIHLLMLDGFLTLIWFHIREYSYNSCWHLHFAIYL